MRLGKKQLSSKFSNAIAKINASLALGTVKVRLPSNWSKGEGEIPTGEKPTGEKPTGEIPTGDIPTGEKPTGEIPTGEIPTKALRRHYNGERPPQQSGQDIL